jgi:hypothetical protein
MKKLVPVMIMAIGLSVGLAVNASALNQDKLQNRLEKLQNKLEKIENRIETREARLGWAATISNPEPSTMLLLGTGIAAFAMWRLRKRHS